MTTLRECTTPPSEPVEWEVEWYMSDVERQSVTGHYVTTTARTAFEAHRQVPQAPAFGSCRVRRVQSEPSFHDYAPGEDAHERALIEADIAKAKAPSDPVQKT